MERYKMITGANVLILKDKKILLSQRKNTGFMDGSYSIIGGHVEEKESLKEAAIREAREEIGITIYPEDLELVHILHDGGESPRVQFYFKIEKWDGDVVNKEQERCENLKWFSLNELPENMVPGVKFAVKEFLKGKNYSEFGW